MTRKTRTPFRPSILDCLEDRAVPSSGLHSAQASSAATRASQALKDQLNAVGTQVIAAYAAFATTVHQAEVSLLTASPSLPAVTALSDVAVGVNTLQQNIGSALQGRAGSDALGLLQQELTGPGPGSLSSGLTSILVASTVGSSTLAPLTASVPLALESVEGAITASLASTSSQIYLYATGQASAGTRAATGKVFNSNVTTGSRLDLDRIGNGIAAAYSSFATSVRFAELSLLNPAAAPTPAALASTFNQDVGTLLQSLTAVVAKTPVAAEAAVLQDRFTGAGPGSLSSRLTRLVAAASTSGSIPPSSLPLLFTAVDAAINSSFTASAVDGYLLDLGYGVSTGAFLPFRGTGG